MAFHVTLLFLPKVREQPPKQIPFHYTRDYQCGIFIYFLIFYCYKITVVPVLPSSAQPTPGFHSQSLHCCPCPWVICTCSLTSPFPFFPPYTPLPPLWSLPVCSVFPCFWKGQKDGRWGCGEKGTLVQCWWECRLVQPLWKTVWNFLRTLKMGLPFDPLIPLLGIYPKNPKSPVQKNLCTLMFIAALFTMAKWWKQPKCPSVN